MVRSPEVFVRPLSMPEEQRLQRISRTAKDPVRLRRAMGVRDVGPNTGAGAHRGDNRTRARIRVIASCRPRDLVQPFSTWSLSKLRDHLIATRVVSSISRETIRTILTGAGVSWQATKTWKGSSDPDFTGKMRRVLDLYDHPPANGRVVCVDEFGPLKLQPRAGRAWRPARHRPDYGRPTDAPKGRGT